MWMLYFGKAYWNIFWTKGQIKIHEKSDMFWPKQLYQIRQQFGESLCQTCYSSSGLEWNVCTVKSVSVNWAMCCFVAGGRWWWSHTFAFPLQKLNFMTQQLQEVSLNLNVFLSFNLPFEFSALGCDAILSALKWDLLSKVHYFWRKKELC